MGDGCACVSGICLISRKPAQGVSGELAQALALDHQPLLKLRRIFDHQPLEQIAGVAGNGAIAGSYIAARIALEGLDIQRIA